MKGMINGHGWLGYKSYRKGIEILQKLHFFKGKITIFKHTS